MAAKTLPAMAPTSSMRSTMGPGASGVPARIGRSGHSADPRRRDALAAAAAIAHTDAEPCDIRSAELHDVSRRTANRWGHEGPPQMLAFQTYLLNSPEPFRLWSHVKSLVKQRAFLRMSDTELIARYHELRPLEKQLEGQDGMNDVCRGVAWLDRAAAKERDAAIDEELAAVFREFAARGITEADVERGAR